MATFCIKFLFRIQIFFGRKSTLKVEKDYLLPAVGVRIAVTVEIMGTLGKLLQY